MHAVILAGGKGIRLRPYTTALPKPLVPIGSDHVILEILLEQLAAQGFTSVTLAINHLGRLIRAYVGHGKRWGLRVDYVEESVPLNTVGPLFGMRDTLPEDFVVLNGDLLTSIRFDDLLATHVRSGAPMTVATMKSESRVEFGVLDIVDGDIRAFTEKPTVVHHVSMGVYAMSRSTIAGYPSGSPMGVDELILDLLARSAYPSSYPFSGLWLDIGRPDDYDRANTALPELWPLLMPDAASPVARVAAKGKPAAAKGQPAAGRVNGSSALAHISGAA